MASPYSERVRKAALKAVSAGRKRIEIARELKVNPSTISRWVEEHNKTLGKKETTLSLQELLDKLPSTANKRFAIYLKNQYSERVAIAYCKVILTPYRGNQKHKLGGLNES